ncbi:winged helix-turn-helix domain-containing protein [Streptomyces sp. NPDC059443]|uniref:winged helix-turn-helix domain-containing protein n=1 Tax=unclassified Streptomyces TaxID=2593676 RepID=UPI00368739BA
MTAPHNCEREKTPRPHYQLLADDVVRRVGQPGTDPRIPDAGEIAKRYRIPYPTAQFVRRAARTRLRTPGARYAPPRVGVTHAWELIADLIRGRILDRGLRGRLPNRPTLATEYRVSVDTVSKAVQALEREGLVVCNRHQGTYVIDPSGN